MTNPRKPGATVEKVERTARGGQRLTIRNSDGTTEITTTSASTTRAIQRAVRNYNRALKELADE
jgi:hypothetical protein